MTSSRKLKIIEEITAYTDGSCMNQKNRIYCGYGVHFPGKELKDISKPFTKGNLTNQRTELYAIYKAIKKISKKYIFNKIVIYSDSNYSIRCATLWINSWKKNNWKTANKKDVLNQDIIKKIDKLMMKYKGKIEFHHVNSHTGKKDAHSVGNDEADKLAKAGAMKLKQLIRKIDSEE